MAGFAVTIEVSLGEADDLDYILYGAGLENGGGQAMNVMTVIVSSACSGVFVKQELTR